MNEFIKTIQDQHQAILTSLIEHIRISLFALLIACLIAIPLAIILTNHKKTAEFSLQVAGVFQTIPSLALLGLLIPIVGIGSTPAIIALVLYAIMPILQNTYEGLTSINPSLKEAATAFGLSRFKTLQRLELPNAMPVILSGIRIALVMIIGTATLAALVGAGGLGTYILLGIETNNNTLIIIGAVLAALLALFFSLLLKGLGKLSLKTITTILISTLIILFFWFLGTFLFQPKHQITIAGKMGSEPEILINMYKELINQDDPNIKVNLKPNFGTTTFLYEALKNNQIQVYPEFTGTVLQDFEHKTTISHNPNVVYNDAKNFLKTKNNLTYLPPMKYQNGYAIAVTPQFAKQYNLKDISDLDSHQEQIKAGFTPDFYHQSDGYPGIHKTYGLTIKNVKTMDPSLLYKAISTKQVNLIDGYTTDADIQRYHLIILKDNKDFFPPYQGAALLNDDAIKQDPKIKKSLSKLANKITTNEMREMNYEVQINHKNSAAVAHQYLKNHNMLKK